MIRKSTWVVFGIFIVLGLAAIFLRWSPSSPMIEPTATPASTASPFALQGLTSIDVNSITLDRAEGSIALVRNADLTWTRNGDLIVEAGKVEELLANVLTMRVLTELAPDYPLDTLALNPPAQVLTLETAAGTTRIAIGSGTPTESGTYLQIDNNPAIVVSKYAIEAILLAFDNAAPSTPTPQVGEVTPAP